MINIINKIEVIPIPDDPDGFYLVEIKNNIPHCRLHGAMLKVSSSGLWRCIRAEPMGKYVGDGIKRDCRAGCKEFH